MLRFRVEIGWALQRLRFAIGVELFELLFGHVFLLGFTVGGGVSCMVLKFRVFMSFVGE